MYVPSHPKPLSFSLIEALQNVEYKFKVDVLTGIWFCLGDLSELNYRGWIWSDCLKCNS